MTTQEKQIYKEEKIKKNLIEGTNLIAETLEQITEDQLNKLIDFQIFLNKKKLINNYGWDFEKEAKKFLKIKS